MRNTPLWQAFSVAVIIALTGFAMVACSNDSPNFSNVNMDGIWHGTGEAAGVIITLSDTNWAISGGGFSGTGTFNRTGDTASLFDAFGLIGTARIVGENRVRVDIPEGIFYFNRS